MIHGEHSLVFALGSIAENGVWNVGAGEGGDSYFVERGDGGCDDGFFLVAKRTVFTGMRIEPADGEAGRGDSFFR